MSATISLTCLPMSQTAELTRFTLLCVNFLFMIAVASIFFTIAYSSGGHLAVVLFKWHLPPL